MISKITDDGYFLPNILALEGHDTFKSGANQPMLIRGVCENTGSKGDFVLKYMGAERMSNEANARELLGAFIAKELNLNVVEPVIINVTPEFVDVLKGTSEHYIANKSIGLNYGSKYLTGKLEFQSPKELTASQFNQAVNIFAFDVFLSNADRTVVNNKQNMFTDGEDIFLYDHELAFGFIFDIFPNKQPWLIRPNDLNWIKNHYFYPALKGKDINFEDFTATFSSLNSDFWQKCKSIIPKDWLTDQVGLIEDYLGTITMNNNVFAEEIKRIIQ